MDFIRKHFPVTEKYAFFDVANKCAPPAPVVDAICSFFQAQAATGGDKEAWFRKVDEVKEKFAQLIHADRRSIALMKNTSEGFNLIANSMRFSPGDNIVITDLEHPNNVFPWLRLKDKGVEVRVLESHDGTVTPEDFENIVDQKTRLCSVTSVACVTGARLDLKNITRICHEKGTRVMVDGVQACGILDFDAPGLGFDFMAAGAYKGMLSPHGLAFLYVRPDRLAELTPPFAARASVKVATTLHKVKAHEVQFKEDAGKFEVGNYNYAASWAGCAALDFLISIGMPRIEKHVLDMTGLFVDGLERLGMPTLGPRDRANRSGIVSVSVEDDHAAVKVLLDAGVITSPREGSVRFSFHAYNNEQDVEQALSALAKLKLH